jgi:hypothetical protein
MRYFLPSKKKGLTSVGFRTCDGIAASQHMPQAHGASGKSGGSGLLSSAATITMRIGLAAEACPPPDGSDTDSTVITE